MGNVIKLRSNIAPYKKICCSKCGEDIWQIVQDEQAGKIKKIICANPDCRAEVTADLRKERTNA